MHVPELDEKIDLYQATTDQYIGTFKVDGYPERIARNARGFQLDLRVETLPQTPLLVEAIFKMPTRLEIIEYVTQTIVKLEDWTPMPPLEPIPIPVKREEVEIPLLVVPERIIEAERKPLTLELVKVIQISRQGFVETLNVILMSRDGRRFVRGTMKIISLSNDMNHELYYGSILFLHDTTITTSAYNKSEYYSSIVTEHSTEKPYPQPLMTGIIVFAADDSILLIDQINPSFVYTEVVGSPPVEFANPHIYAFLEKERNNEIKIKAKTLITNVIFSQMNYEKMELSSEESLEAHMFFMNDQTIATRDGFIRFYYKFESDEFFYPNTVYFLLYDDNDFITEAIVYLKV